MFIEVDMPKGFSEREKRIIRTSLLDAGNRFLKTYGIQKTTVQDLVRAAGISKGAFYFFFDSKDDLFVKVLEDADVEIRKLIHPRGGRRQSLKSTLTNAVAALEEQPVLANLSRDDNEYLRRRVAERRLRIRLRSEDAFVSRILASAKRDGIRFKGSPAAITALLKSLFFMTLHKEDIGEGYSDAIQEVVDTIANHAAKD